MDKKMKVWRLLDTGIRAAAENMALDEAILEARSQNLVPNTIRFLQFSPPAILVGYHQSVEEEVRVNYCREKGLDINRRLTGGGTILFDEPQLGWELIASKEDFQSTIMLEKTFREICSALVYALKKFSLEAAFRPKNDIEIGGRKISGTGGTEEGGAFLFQGTLLIDFDLETMLRALRIPTEKLKDKEIDSVRERVTWLGRELGYIPKIGEIKAAIKEGFEKVFKIKFKEEGLTKEEERLFTQKVDKFKSSAWIHKVREPFGLQALRSAHKTKGGLIRVSLIINPKANLIQNILITGDFFLYPQRIIYDLEATLKNTEATPGNVERKVFEFFKDNRLSLFELAPIDFMEAIKGALRKGEYLKYGIPISEVNRIFTVNNTFEKIVKKDIPILLIPYCAKPLNCVFRQRKDCQECGECTVGEAYGLARERGMLVTTILNFEDLMETLEECKSQGMEAFLGSCCEAFYIKHREDLERIGLPGILIDVDNQTCYDLGKEREGRTGNFENQTNLRLDLLKKVVALTKGRKPEKIEGKL